MTLVPKFRWRVDRCSPLADRSADFRAQWTFGRREAAGLHLPHIRPAAAAARVFGRPEWSLRVWCARRRWQKG